MSNRTGIMLCYPFTEDRLKKWPVPYIIQPKLDGDRCRAIFDEYGRVTLLSSEENIITSAPHIIEQLEDMHLHNIELDGELFSPSLRHQAIRSIVGRTVNIHPDFETLEYHIFDIVNSDNQARRCQTLIDTVKESDNVKIVQTNIADNMSDIMSWLEKYMSEGKEGIIVRHLLSPYVRKRSTLIMKFKPWKEDYYIITGFEEEIDKYGTPKDSLGALWLRSNMEEPFKVGSGSFLTRDNRIHLWSIKEQLVGKVAHIRYQKLTDRSVPNPGILVDIINPTFKF
jgi:ATP-dependent DNA ligase